VDCWHGDPLRQSGAVLEHKRLYREPLQPDAASRAGLHDPVGKARISGNPGANLTIITYGALVQKSLQAAVQMEQHDPARGPLRLIDLRTLNPYDWTRSKASVRKDRRVMIAHEDTLSWGFGAEFRRGSRASCSAGWTRRWDENWRAGHMGGLRTHAQNEMLPQWRISSKKPSESWLTNGASAWRPFS